MVMKDGSADRHQLDRSPATRSGAAAPTVAMIQTMMTKMAHLRLPRKGSTDIFFHMNVYGTYKYV